MAMSKTVVITLLCLTVWLCEGHSIYSWTNQGLVQGLLQDGVQTFLGVPFAAPPERFKPPQTPRFRWHTFNAQSFGNPCPQYSSLTDSYFLNEDCLNLNIYAPLQAHIGKKLPVLVYWYGGSFISGSNSEPYNQPEALVQETDIIVVTPNHRLGALGYLYIDQLSEADGYKNNKVNFALLDLIAALTWVQDNIAYFGGDPTSVTIGGHSSGAYQVSWLTTIPQSWHLFSRVIELEGPITALDEAIVYSEDVANQIGQDFIAIFNCDLDDPNAVLNCLATADLEALIVAGDSAGLLPVVDGDLFPQNPDVAISDPSLGLVHKVPSFMMATPNPGTYFVGPFVDDAVALGWLGFMEYMYGTTVGPLIAALYPDSIYGEEDATTIFIRGSYFISDSVWLCPLRRHANFQKAFTPSVWVTVWNVRASFITVPLEYGILHGTEVPFIFGNAINIVTQEPGVFTSKEALLSKRIMATVGRFVRTGDPGDEWPTWRPEVHTEIDLVDLVVKPLLTEIRVPPPGELGPPFDDGTRCGLFDILFDEELEGKLDRKIYENVIRNFNIWSRSNSTK